MFEELKKVLENNLIYQFKGEKNRENIKTELDNIEKCLPENKLKKRISRCIVDLSLGAIKLNEIAILKNEFVLKIGLTYNNYILYYSETLNQDLVEATEKSINLVNSLSLEELKKFQQEILVYTPNRINYKAPLSLVQVRRNLKNTIFYNKQNLGENMYIIEMILQFL